MGHHHHVFNTAFAENLVTTRLEFDSLCHHAVQALTAISSRRHIFVWIGDVVKLFDLILLLLPAINTNTKEGDSSERAYNNTCDGTSGKPLYRCFRIIYDGWCIHRIERR